MSDEPATILPTIPPALPAQGDYDTICAALMLSERGRWFLQEYARRNRSADTRVLLDAIEQLESVVRAQRDRQAAMSFRADLIEMATAITRTRAEVALIKSQDISGADQTAGNGTRLPATPASDAADIFASAERIRDVTWAMRGHGFDPSTCNQLEELATSILSASSLRDPNDHRVRKLNEVLHYLERRIEVLIESCAESVAVAPQAEADDAEAEAEGETASRTEPAPGPEPRKLGCRKSPSPSSFKRMKRPGLASWKRPAVARSAPPRTRYRRSS
jgi:hypothetical protein